MNDILDPTECVLIAQVRKADASHCVETSTQLLRSKHFPGKSEVVYLGDMTTALLAHLTHPETPAFSQPPKYNEQRWILETRSSDLEVRIESAPYWAWGLLTSGYLNIIHLRETHGSACSLDLGYGQFAWATSVGICPSKTSNKTSSQACQRSFSKGKRTNLESDFGGRQVFARKPY